MTEDDDGGGDGDRDVGDDDANEWFAASSDRDDESHDHDDGDVGAAAVDDRDPSGSGRASEEPLGDLRERVVDGDEPRPSGTSFPGSARSTADGSDGHGNGETGGSAPESDAADTDADPTIPETGRDGPLGDLAAGIDGRQEQRTTTDEELFDEVDVGDVDADELWSQVESDGPTVEPRGEREVREVEKRKYCSQCPYFSDPPAVGCSHEGTDILQQVDMEHFEVADCPVVLEDERLEDVTTE
jgi:hypothetical protein